MFLLTFLFLHVTFPVLKATDTLGVNLLLISNNIIDKGRSVVAIYNMSVGLCMFHKHMCGSHKHVCKSTWRYL